MVLKLQLFCTIYLFTQVFLIIIKRLHYNCLRMWCSIQLVFLPKMYSHYWWMHGIQGFPVFVCEWIGETLWTPPIYWVAGVVMVVLLLCRRIHNLLQLSIGLNWCCNWPIKRALPGSVFHLKKWGKEDEEEKKNRKEWNPRPLADWTESVCVRMYFRATATSIYWWCPMQQWPLSTHRNDPYAK